MSLFNPMNEIMGQKHKTQESVNGIEFARAQILNVVDMARLGEKRLNGLALIVESEAVLHTEAISGQIRINQEVFEDSVGQVELVQQTAITIDRREFNAMHQFINRNPVLQRNRLGQPTCQSGVMGFEQKIALAFQEHSAVSGCVVTCIQTANHLERRIIAGQNGINIMQQIRQ